jgi:hypothetical protein
MAITQAMCDSFKVQILGGQQNLISGGATYKIALYTSSAVLSNATTAWTATAEVTNSGSNYTTGGNTLSVSTSPTSTGNVAFMSFANSSWTNANITANGALIYNATTTANTAVAVLAFGGDKTATNGTFTVIFPTADSSNAIIRIA